MSFEIGQVVGGYEIMGTIGAGGMGTVYRVRNPFTDRVDAMKVLLHDPACQDDLAARFSREIKIHASLRHPNIAALYTAMQHQGQLLMVMEFVEGITLEDRLKYGTLGICEAVDCMTQMLAALGFAHQHGVVHRDIKPSNIMLTPTGVLKLLDFGIARGASDLSVTSKGSVIGSLLYMSPEQIRGEAVDARSDIYAAGCTLYQMLTGKPPFATGNAFAVMRAQAESLATPPGEINSAVERGLSNAVMKALEKNPSDRYQSAESFASALEAFRFSTAQTTLQPPPTQPQPTTQPTTQPIIAQGWDPAVLDRLRRALAPYIGPMAKVLVERSAKRTDNYQQLCRMLSQEIDNPAERNVFLSKANNAATKP